MASVYCSSSPKWGKVPLWMKLCKVKSLQNLLAWWSFIAFSQEPKPPLNMDNIETQPMEPEDQQAWLELHAPLPFLYLQRLNPQAIAMECAEALEDDEVSSCSAGGNIKQGKKITKGTFQDTSWALQCLQCRFSYYLSLGMFSCVRIPGHWKRRLRSLSNKLWIWLQLLWSNTAVQAKILVLFWRRAVDMFDVFGVWKLFFWSHVFINGTI